MGGEQDMRNLLKKFVLSVIFEGEMVSYMLKDNLRFFGEIQVTRYKDTRYEITLRQQPFYILYLVSPYLVSLRQTQI